MVNQTTGRGGRRIRLKPEYARSYGGLEAGAWLPVSEAAEQLVRRAEQLRSVGVHRRTFDPRHFEFQT
jgi:hypothetical protein